MNVQPKKQMRDLPVDDEFASDRLDALRESYDRKQSREGSSSALPTRKKNRGFIFSIVVVGGMIFFDQKIGGGAMWVWLVFCAMAWWVLTKFYRLVDTGGSYDELYDAAMNCVRYENFTRDFASGTLEFYADRSEYEDQTEKCDASFVDTSSWDDFWRRVEIYFHLFEHVSVRERERMVRDRLEAAQPAFRSMVEFAKVNNARPLYWVNLLEKS